MRLARRLAALALLLLAGTARAGTSDTAEPVPGQPFGASATFLSDLQTFLRFEDAARFVDMFQSFVVTGCLGPVSANLTHTPSACLAYPGGLRTKEHGSITYQDTSTCWTIVHRDTLGNVTGPDGFVYQRVPDTHYAVNCTAPTLPQTPPSSVLVMKVTTLTGAITAVADLRQRSPINTQTAGTCDLGTASCLPTGICASGTCCLPTAGVCDVAITDAKLADAAVTTAKLATASVSNSKLQAAAVSTAKLFPGATVRGLTEDNGWNAPGIPAGETLLRTMAITSHGGPVIFLLQGVGSVTTGSLVMKLKLDGVDLSEADLGGTGTPHGAEMTATRFSVSVPGGAHSVTVTGACPAGGLCSFFTHVLSAYESG